MNNLAHSGLRDDRNDSDIHEDSYHFFHARVGLGHVFGRFSQ